jgi:hypothetical protein
MQASPDELPLPLLREDLRLFPGAPHTDSSPAWIIEAPYATAISGSAGSSSNACSAGT